MPSWRATKDISSKHDLVEEVGRLIGYGEIRRRLRCLPAVVPARIPMRRYLREVRFIVLPSQGFTEVYNYSFVNESQVKRFGDECQQPSGRRESDCLRVDTHAKSLLPGVFDIGRPNARHLRDFRFFEIGSEIHARRWDPCPTKSLMSWLSSMAFTPMNRNFSS